MASHKFFACPSPKNKERLVSALRELRRKQEIYEFHERGDEDTIEITVDTRNAEHLRQVVNRYA